jgi:hypothetical protein
MFKKLYHIYYLSNKITIQKIFIYSNRIKLISIIFELRFYLFFKFESMYKLLFFNIFILF